MSIVGYGENENAERGKRLGTMEHGISYVDYGSTNGIRNTISLQATAEGQSACGGDSGGALLRFVAGEPRLAGVLVGAGFTEAGKCGTSQSAIAVNMAAYAPWIEQITGGARVPVGPAPTCTVSITPGVVRLPGGEGSFVEFTVNVVKAPGALDFGGPNGVWSVGIVDGAYLREGTNRTRLGAGRYTVRKTVISESHGVLGECFGAFEVQAAPLVPTATATPQPTLTPTDFPTPWPTPRPTPRPTAIPTPRPTAVPTPLPSPTPSFALRTPTGFRVVRAGPVQAIFRWNDTSMNETGYQVLRSTAGGAFEVVAGLGPNATTYHDRSLQPNTRYQYRVRAYHASGSFAESAVVVLPAGRSGAARANARSFDSRGRR